MYSLTVVGGGAISSGYDSLKDKKILTHIHAALIHSKIDLNAVIEIDKKQQLYIKEKWGDGFEISSDSKKIFQKYKSDIVIVATPTKTHLQVIKEIYNLYEPMLILCEKPIVLDMDELNELERIQEQKSTKILTNYIRRFDPTLNRVKLFMDKNKEKINHFYGTFTKGFLHNGSHMIDLIYMLIGEIDSIDIIDKKIISNDIFGKFIIKTENGFGMVSNINNDSLSLFEFVIYADNAKIEIRSENQDVCIYTTDKSETFNNYISFSKVEKLPKTLDKYGYNSLEFAIKMIQNNKIYNDVKMQQSKVNRFILHTKQKFMG